jgi:hypothetical protein
MGTKAERRTARERVSAYHQAQLAGLLSHIAAAIDRYRDGEIDACPVDETIHHYHLAATQLWKFCFACGGGTHAEFIAGILDACPPTQKPSTGGNAPHRDDTNNHDRAARSSSESCLRAVMSTPWEGSRCGPRPAAVIYLTGHRT